MSRHAHGVRFTGDPLPALVAERGDDLPACEVHVGPVSLPALPVLAELRDTDGAPALELRGEPGRVTVWARGHGTGAVIEPGRIAVDLPGGPAWLRSRLLTAQVLPIAATLAGRECLHAAAVALPAGVVALTAASGTGKSSVAWHMQAHGAAFVTDDVLAVDDELLAHPGPRLARVATDEHAAAPSPHAVLGREDEVHVAATGLCVAASLAAVVVLERGDRPALQPYADPLAAVLGATYLPWLSFPDRLERHLGIATAVARGDVLRCTIGPEETAAGVARRLLTAWR